MTVTRPITAWTIFGVCLIMVLAGLAWVTTHTLRLEHSRRQAEATRELDERVRLAVGRMDTVAGTLVATESARHPNHFKDFYASDQLYTNTFQIIQKGQVIVPSPILSSLPLHAKLYFQVNPGGNLTSPQVPTGNNRDLAEQNYMSGEEIALADGLLQEAQEFVQTLSSLQEPQGSDSANDQQPYRTGATIKSKSVLALEQAVSAGVDLAKPDSAQAFRGVWHKSELLLTRKATLASQDVLQGVWLKADVIKARLLTEIHDLLPDAKLSVTVSDIPSTNPSGARTLVSLPFQLDPDEPAKVAGPFWTPTRRTLVIAWVCCLAAAAAAGMLLVGIVSLSERRAAFVSAVTHEMRTPLTTFRLYSEMLAKRMVPDRTKQEEYLNTLHSEANRLSHLVENVLAYARLEKGSARAQVEEIPLPALITRISPRLQQRAEQAGASLDVDEDPDTNPIRLHVDTTAVEQILFNLVDNACKYGHTANGPPSIHLRTAMKETHVELRVCDEGPGIDPAERTKLFHPFQKSATEAAHSAPGVGIGLALSRKLAQALGGKLELDATAEGTCFVLTLPVIS